MNSPRQPRVTEVAFTKNEGRFLLEWIAYHRLIGVTDFLIYTNDCEDESPALLDRLQEMGIVAHLPNPRRSDEQPQNAALSAALAHPLVMGADYALQIDPDEFLVVKTERGAIQDLIAAAPAADVIAVQMRFFGDSGLARLGSGLVSRSKSSSRSKSRPTVKSRTAMSRPETSFHAATRSVIGRMGVRDWTPSSPSIRRRERLSTMVTSCPRADTCRDVGQPQNPSPPSTMIFKENSRSAAADVYTGNPPGQVRKPAFDRARRMGIVPAFPRPGGRKPRFSANFSDTR